MSKLDRHSSWQLRPPHRVHYVTRREMLAHCGMGFGALAFQYLLSQEVAFGEQKQPKDPLNRQAVGPHFSPRAKSVIFLFMEGGPSHIDLFDPKPVLEKLAGQPLPESFGPVITPMGEYDAPLMASRRRWKQHGQSGIWVSDWLPHIATCVDDLTIIRSCWANGLNHSNGVCQMNTGSILGGRPSLGAWVSYGLGTENQNLPAFIVLEDAPNKVVNGARNWSSGFMPARYQGVALRTEGDPIRDLANPPGIGMERQSGKRDLLRELDRRFARMHPEESELEAKIRSYELAFRMQAAAPLAVDLSQETAETLALYGIGEEPTDRFGRMCLLARRLVERGVRFVQLYHGAGSRWDAHSKLEENHGKNCRESDKPVAGLIQDLKRRGLLEETLVVWGGEFGRTPMSEKGDGRDHNPYGFTMWMAGGGVKAGYVYGATDEIGLHAVENRVHVHDLHATILYLLGIDHMKLVYHYKGRPERATLNEGEPVRDILA
ncbi:MAG: hypothetical protein KatS3mg110_0400 [Pirellulaceae bacterium]|nr:MAG: hypothetical protein KatS3mg110_0400 [Pirellulaceae bacterium]